MFSWLFKKRISSKKNTSPQRKASPIVIKPTIEQRQAAFMADYGALNASNRAFGLGYSHPYTTVNPQGLAYPKAFLQDEASLKDIINTNTHYNQIVQALLYLANIHFRDSIETFQACLTKLSLAECDTLILDNKRTADNYPLISINQLLFQPSGVYKLEEQSNNAHQPNTFLGYMIFDASEDMSIKLFLMQDTKVLQDWPIDSLSIFTQHALIFQASLGSLRAMKALDLVVKARSLLLPEAGDLFLNEVDICCQKELIIESPLEVQHVLLIKAVKVTCAQNIKSLKLLLATDVLNHVKGTIRTEILNFSCMLWLMQGHATMHVEKTCQIIADAVFCAGKIDAKHLALNASVIEWVSAELNVDSSTIHCQDKLIINDSSFDVGKKLALTSDYELTVAQLAVKAKEIGLKERPILAFHSPIQTLDALALTNVTTECQATVLEIIGNIFHDSDDMKAVLAFTAEKKLVQNELVKASNLLVKSPLLEQNGTLIAQKILGIIAEDYTVTAPIHIISTEMMVRSKKFKAPAPLVIKSEKITIFSENINAYQMDIHAKGLTLLGRDSLRLGQSNIVAENQYIQANAITTRGASFQGNTMFVAGTSDRIDACFGNETTNTMISSHIGLSCSLQIADIQDAFMKLWNKSVLFSVFCSGLLIFAPQFTTALTLLQLSILALSSATVIYEQLRQLKEDNYQFLDEDFKNAQNELQTMLSLKNTLIHLGLGGYSGYAIYQLIKKIHFPINVIWKDLFKVQSATNTHLYLTQMGLTIAGAFLGQLLGKKNHTALISLSFGMELGSLIQTDVLSAHFGVDALLSSQRTSVAMLNGLTAFNLFGGSTQSFFIAELGKAYNALSPSINNFRRAYFLSSSFNNYVFQGQHLSLKTTNPKLVVQNTAFLVETLETEKNKPVQIYNSVTDIKHWSLGSYGALISSTGKLGQVDITTPLKSENNPCGLQFVNSQYDVTAIRFSNPAAPFMLITDASELQLHQNIVLKEGQQIIGRNATIQGKSLEFEGGRVILQNSAATFEKIKRSPFPREYWFARYYDGTHSRREQELRSNNSTLTTGTQMPKPVQSPWKYINCQDGKVIYQISDPKSSNSKQSNILNFPILSILDMVLSSQASQGVTLSIGFMHNCTLWLGANGPILVQSQSHQQNGTEHFYTEKGNILFNGAIHHVGPGSTYETASKIHFNNASYITGSVSLLFYGQEGIQGKPRKETITTEKTSRSGVLRIKKTKKTTTEQITNNTISGKDVKIYLISKDDKTIRVQGINIISSQPVYMKAGGVVIEGTIGKVTRTTRGLLFSQNQSHEYAQASNILAPQIYVIAKQSKAEFTGTELGGELIHIEAPESVIFSNFILNHKAEQRGIFLNVLDILHKTPKKIVNEQPLVASFNGVAHSEDIYDFMGSLIKLGVYGTNTIAQYFNAPSLTSFLAQYIHSTALAAVGVSHSKTTTQTSSNNGCHSVQLSIKTKVIKVNNGYTVSAQEGDISAQRIELNGALLISHQDNQRAGISVALNGQSSFSLGTNRVDARVMSPSQFQINHLNANIGGILVNGGLFQVNSGQGHIGSVYIQTYKDTFTVTSFGIEFSSGIPTIAMLHQQGVRTSAGGFFINDSTHITLGPIYDNNRVVTPLPLSAMTHPQPYKVSGGGVRLECAFHHTSQSQLPFDATPFSITWGDHTFDSVLPHFHAVSDEPSAKISKTPQDETSEHVTSHAKKVIATDEKKLLVPIYLDKNNLNNPATTYIPDVEHKGDDAPFFHIAMLLFGSISQVRVAYLYRGDLRSPEDIFYRGRGFSARGANLDLNAHILGVNAYPSSILADSAYISTSQSIAEARRFPTLIPLETEKTYIYVINPSPNSINIKEALSDLPHNSLELIFAQSEKEIAIPYKIPGEDIKCAWVVSIERPSQKSDQGKSKKEKRMLTGDIISNPDYKPPLKKRIRKGTQVFGFFINGISLGMDGYRLFKIYEENSETGDFHELKQEATGTAFAWGASAPASLVGAETGAELGAAFGPAGVIIGGLLGGLAGGIGGSIAGEQAGKKLYSRP